jgi:glycosyltransferase involved in cell wall biosynthesis
MVALESMSCGVPVIGVDEWGIRETVIDGKTGILISSDATKEELIQAVQKLDIETALTMKDACIERAREFSLESFEKIVREKFL